MYNTVTLIPSGLNMKHEGPSLTVPVSNNQLTHPQPTCQSFWVRKGIIHSRH